MYNYTADNEDRECMCMFDSCTCICTLQEEPTPCGPTAYNISVFLVFDNTVNISINYSSTADNTNLRVIYKDVKISSVGGRTNCIISNGTIMDCITSLKIAFKDRQYPLTQLLNDTSRKLYVHTILDNNHYPYYCINIASVNTDLNDGLNVTRVCRSTTVDSIVPAIVGTSATIAFLLFLVVIMITILIIVMLFKGKKRQSSSQNHEDNADTHSNTYQVINTSAHGESAGNVVEGGLGFVMTGHPDLPAPPLDLTSNLMTLEQWREQETAVPNPFYADALPVDTTSKGQLVSDPPDYETIPEANHNHFLTQRITTHSMHLGQSAYPHARSLQNLDAGIGKDTPRLLFSQENLNVQHGIKNSTYSLVGEYKEYPKEEFKNPLHASQEGSRLHEIESEYSLLGEDFYAKASKNELINGLSNADGIMSSGQNYSDASVLVQEDSLQNTTPIYSQINKVNDEKIPPLTLASRSLVEGSGSKDGTISSTNMPIYSQVIKKCNDGSHEHMVSIYSQVNDPKGILDGEVPPPVPPFLDVDNSNKEEETLPPVPPFLPQMDNNHWDSSPVPPFLLDGNNKDGEIFSLVPPFLPKMDRKFLSASLFLPEIDTDEDSNHLEPPPVPPSLPDIENKDNNSNDLVGRDLLENTN